ncbi:MAG: two-component regulator propeller domain-containing protein [Vicinamibacterales bacterium]
MDSEAVHAPAPSEQPRKLFRCISLGQEAADHVNVLQEDAAGRIWIGTDGGLYRFDDGLAGTRPRFVDLRDPDAAKRPVWVSALLAGDADEMWVGTNLGLIRLLADGRALPYRVASTASPGEVRDIARGADGRVWVAYPRGLLLVRPVAAPDPLIRRSTMPADEQESRWIDLVEGEVGESALLVSVDGHAWIGTDRGLLEFDGQRFRRYGAAHGLPERLISELARDRDDNVWIAALSGVTKLSQHGFITYDKHDGLTPATIHSLFEDSSGHVFAVGDSWIVSRFDGTRFVSVRPRMAPATPGWAAQLAFLDRAGAWWILGQTGLARYPAAEGIDQIHDRPPPVVYASLGGAPGQGLFRLFEDARGDIWWGAAGETGGLGRWGRATNSFVRYPDAQGDVRGDKASAFGEDASGALWIGFYRGGLLRYDGGRFERLSGKDVPGGMITAIHRDSRGRLWIGSNRDGLTRVDDPTDGRRRFVRYTTADGLSSGNVRCVISDATDRIYVGTVRGVDRLDPPSGAIRRYTTADGLANGFVTAALRDSNGGLWFGTLDGLSRLVPRREGIPAPPSTWIEGWRINGVPQGVSHLGQALVSRVVLQPRQNQIQIEFYGWDSDEAARCGTSTASTAQTATGAARPRVASSTIHISLPGVTASR